MITYKLRHSSIGHTALVSMGVAVSAAPFTQANLDAALASFALNIKTQYSAAVTFSGAVALIGNDGPLLRLESVGSVVGTRSLTNYAPPNVACLVAKSTAFSGRPYRGRMYMPFCAEADINDGGDWTTTARNNWQTAINAWFVAMLNPATCNTDDLVLLHSPVGGSPAPAPTSITALNVSTLVATQRRRLER